MVCCLVTRYHITGEIPIALIPHHQDNHATPTWQTTEHNSVLTNMHPYLTQIPLKTPPPTQQECIPYATEKFSLTGIEPISLYSPFLPPYNYHSLPTQRPTERFSVWWNMPQTSTGIPKSPDIPDDRSISPKADPCTPHTRYTENVHNHTHCGYLKSAPRLR